MPREEASEWMRHVAALLVLLFSTYVGCGPSFTNLPLFCEGIMWSGKDVYCACVRMCECVLAQLSTGEGLLFADSQIQKMLINRTEKIIPVYK